jgi:hypothetical protein
LDEGWTAERLTSTLREIADAELPQPLAYLIADVDRRHGHLVVLPAACCVRSEEPALLREVVTHRALRKLGPHLVTEQVAVFHQEPAVVVQSLREAGFLPVPADGHGVVDLGQAAGQAQPGRPPKPPAADRAVRRLGRDSGPSSEPQERTEAFAAQLLRTAGRDDDAAPRFGAEELIAMYTTHLEPLERRQLGYAIDNRLPVVITYRGATGGWSSRMISDLELVGDLVHAWCHLRDDKRVFNLARIGSVEPVG